MPNRFASEQDLDNTSRSMDVAGARAYLERRRKKQREMQGQARFMDAISMDKENREMDRDIGHVELTRSLMKAMHKRGAKLVSK